MTPTADPSGDGRVLRSRRPFVALVAAGGVSTVGSTVSYVAIPWFVLATTGSPALAGVIAFFEILAVVAASFAGGLVLDRTSHKRGSVVADLASGVAVALVPVVDHLMGLPFALLVVLVLTRSFFDAPASTARAALLPEIAAAAGVAAERANAVVQATERLARIFGAPVAGVLIALVGPDNVFLFDAITFAGSAVIVAVLVPGTRVVRELGVSVRREVADGLAFVRRDPLLRGIFGSVAVTNLLEAPIFAVILPVYVQQAGSSSVDLGLMVAAVGGGAAGGTLVFCALGSRVRRRPVFLGSFVVLGLAYLALAIAATQAWVLTSLVLAGVAAGPINPIIATVLQERVPAALRGRVFGATRAAGFATIPLGMLIAGALVEVAGVRPVLLAIAVGYIGATVTMTLRPAFRELDRIAVPAHRRAEAETAVATGSAAAPPAVAQPQLTRLPRKPVP